MQERFFRSRCIDPSIRVNRRTKTEGRCEVSMAQSEEGVILDIDGGTLRLRIADYQPVPEDEWYYHWAWIDVRMHGKGFDVEKSSPSLLCVEVENLRSVMERFLNKDWLLPKCEMEPEELGFIEPYHRFTFYPPAFDTASKLGIEKGMQGFDLLDVSADWEIELEHGGLLVVIRLNRDNLVKLLGYLQDLTKDCPRFA